MENEFRPSAWLESPGGDQTLIRGACFIGRSATSTLVLCDDRVSRRHAMVQAHGTDEFWLVDLGSANGTYLNSRRITQAQHLKDGDEIKIGGFTLMFRKTKERREAVTVTTERTVQEIRTVQCWLLVADIQDSTNFLKHLPPDEAPRLTGRWFSDCKQLLEDNGGSINKFLGDGFFAYWPAHPETPAGVARALGLFKQLQQKEQPRFRVVLHCGAVVVGGTASMGEESLMGSEVNFVFRMEKVAGSLGQARLLSEAAHIALGGTLPTESAGRHPVPSFDGEFPFYTF